MDLKTVPIQMSVCKQSRKRCRNRQQPEARNIGEAIQGKGWKAPSRGRTAAPTPTPRDNEKWLPGQESQEISFKNCQQNEGLKTNDKSTKLESFLVCLMRWYSFRLLSN
jgi:hypothetical protein